MHAHEMVTSMALKSNPKWCETRHITSLSLRPCRATTYTLSQFGSTQKNPILLLVQCTIMVIHRSMFCYLTLKGEKKKKKKLVVKEGRGPIIWDRAQCPCGHDDCCVPPHGGAARVTNLVEHDILALGCPRQGR
jgi:hypothetical protein